MYFRKAKGGKGEESIIKGMLSGPVYLSTVLVVKPDVLKRHLAKLLNRIAQNGFWMAGFKHGMLTQDQVEALIPQADRQVISR